MFCSDESSFWHNFRSIVYQTIGDDVIIHATNNMNEFKRLVHVGIMFSKFFNQFYVSTMIFPFYHVSKVKFPPFPLSKLC